jgi:hypothetical protein
MKWVLRRTLYQPVESKRDEMEMEMEEVNT